MSGRPQIFPSTHSRDVSCARLANAAAPASLSGKNSGLRHKRRYRYRGGCRSLVACDRVNQALICLWALACHSPANTIVPAADNPASSVAGVSFETLFPRGLNSDRRENTVTRRLFHGAEPQLRRLDFREVAAARVSSASYHLAVVASIALLDPEHSEKRSSMKCGRLFPTPSGRTSNHHSSEPRAPCALERVHVIVFFLRGAIITSRRGVWHI